MGTHTPGPWTDGRLVGICGQDKAALNLAFVMSPDDERRAECEANARLIAAAPELLTLVERYASECAECNGTGILPYGPVKTNPCGVCDDIRAVIAKATGAQS